jgi:hypothetical protein
MSALQPKAPTTSPEAPGLYRGFGFQPWKREPAATRIGDRLFDEIHMTLGM